MSTKNVPKLERTTVEARDRLLGTMIGRRFRVDERIAAGGFGAIYRATHVKSSHVVALKVLHPAMSADPRVVARFRREGATLTALRNPHTVTTYELAEDAETGTLFMVMELLSGASLLERFKAEGSIGWRRMVAIARAVCASLAEAHALGIVHRDLKPANIHLEQHDGNPDFAKVLDFGIAKLLRGSDMDDGQDLTRSNEVIGTYDYVSPEQIIGDSYTGRSDIYTLGVVMYEMITGTRPFDAANSTALLTTILTSAATPPSTRLPGLPPALDAVLLACLDRDPKLRPDAVELATMLDQLLVAGDDNPTRQAIVIVAPTDESEATQIATAPRAIPVVPVAVLPAAPARVPVVRRATVPPPIPSTPPARPGTLTTREGAWTPPRVALPPPSVAMPSPPMFDPALLAPARPPEGMPRQVIWFVVLVLAITVGIVLAAVI